VRIETHCSGVGGLAASIGPIRASAPARAPAPAARGMLRSLAGSAATAQTLVAMWLQRSRARAELEQLDEHLLRDVGLSREQVLQETAKPFWIA
jgi:uncharacterized protein YjiS (DUF1127 family)